MNITPDAMSLRVLPHDKIVKGMRVLVRTDFNVTFGPKGQIGPEDDARIRAALPTIAHLWEMGARVIVMSHLGRPEKRDKAHSLAPVAKRLAKLLDKRVGFIPAALDDSDKVEKAIAKLKDGDIVVLENLRFHKGEAKNDRFLGRRLASLGDIFVNDAFGVAHRKTASTVAITEHIESYAGFLMENELKGLDRAVRKPKKPFVMLIGGAKVATKLPMMERLSKTADSILIGGGMANNFFKAKGFEVGDSLVSRPDVALAKRLLRKRKIRLPNDVLVVERIAPDAPVRVCSPAEVKKGEHIVDIGPETMREYAVVLKGAKTIIWNGPVGLFEYPRFAHGSLILGRVVASRSSGSAYGVVGGGDTLRCLAQTGMSEFVDHVSTGGGAMLDHLAGKTLPGIEPLLVTSDVTPRISTKKKITKRKKKAN